MNINEEKLEYLKAETKNESEIENRSDVKRLNKNDVINNVQEYFYTDDSLALEFENFVARKSYIFKHTCQNEIEYKLEYTEVYNEYKDLFELKLENYIKSLGYSVNEFFEILQDSSNKNTEGSDALFGQMLLAVTEFDVFMQMMKEAASSTISTESKEGDVSYSSDSK